MCGKAMPRMAAVLVCLLAATSYCLGFGRGGSVGFARGGSWGGGDLGGGAGYGGYGAERASEVTSTYRPQNYGSLAYGNSYGDTRVYGDQLYNPQAAQGVGGGSWGAAQGQYGGAVGHLGGGGGWVAGPAGGGAGPVIPPHDNRSAAAQAPAFSAAGNYPMAYGTGAAVRGPAGDAAGVFHGPAGGTVAGVRGPYGAGVVAALPSGYAGVAWHGTTYYHYGYNFYRPYWYNGAVCYWPVAPPVGWFFATLPPDYIAYTAGDTTYYFSNGVYYQPATQDGQQGYVVANDPHAGSSASNSDGGPPQTQFANQVPDPFATFKKMSDFLGSQDQFTLQVADTFDEITDTGAKVQMWATRTAYVQRPNQMAVDFQSDTDVRHVVYDGSTLTAIDVTVNAYTTIAIPGPLDNMMDTLAMNYGMAQPVDNLIYKDIYSRIYPKIKAGQYVGTDTVSGVKCDHLAFRQQGLDWEIWIQQGDQPIPRKLSIIHNATARLAHVHVDG